MLFSFRRRGLLWLPLFLLLILLSLSVAPACGLGGGGGEGGEDGNGDDDELQLVFTEDQETPPAPGGNGGGPPADTPTPAPTLTPTPDPTLSSLVAQITATQVAGRYPATPTPTPTPVVDPLRPTRPPIPTATLRPTPTPTPVPAPTPWAQAPATPEPTEALVHHLGRYSVTVVPGTPFTGDQVRFEVTGLEPYGSLTASFVQPGGEDGAGVAWPWVDRGDILTGEIEREFKADAYGNVVFYQNGTPAKRGGWRLVLLFEGDLAGSFSYSSLEMSLAGLDQRSFGSFFFQGYNGLVAPVYFSGDVPQFFAPALQDRIGAVSAVLGDVLGPYPEYDPTIFLVESPPALERLISELGYNHLDWEKGFYSEFEEPPGVYAVGADFLSDVGYRAAHQYADGYVRHFVGPGLGEMPAWFSEGLSEYFAFESGLQSGDRDATLRRLILDLDEVKGLAEFGVLPSLERIAQLSYWSRSYSHSDVAPLYPYSHMLVRYMAAKHGDGSLLQMLELLAAGQSGEEALLSVTGRVYQDFQSDFSDWIAGWEPAALTEARSYFEVLDGVKRLDEQIATARGLLLLSPLPDVSAWDGLLSRVDEAGTLLEQVAKVPPELADLHGAVLGYLEARKTFLEQEREAKRGDLPQADADALLPEVDYLHSEWLRVERSYRCVLNLLRCGI